MMAEYIDREKVIEMLQQMLKLKLDSWYGMGYLHGVKYASDMLALMPAADVQPVKHGRWIWVKNYRDCEGDICSQYKCSCCDFGVGSVYSVEDLTHFCPNCGARMDGDTE